MRNKIARLTVLFMVCVFALSILSSCGMARRARVRKIENRLERLENRVDNLERRR